MTKSKVKALFVSVLLAAVAVCLSVGLSACGKNKDKDAGDYGVGEEGVYYYDKDSTTEYLMTLQSGNYMISAEGEKSYSGTYSYDEEAKSVSFKDSEGESFAATFSDDAMQLAIEDMPYTFLKRVSYTVTFVDGNSSVASSVVYGRKASAPETDETRIFIGWYEDAAFTTQYKFDTAVTGDMTLYAYYIDIDATIANYDVTFIDGGETVYETKTQNGVVYDIPDYEGILGWWVSDTNEEDSLTYKYEGQILTEAKKLFAVKEGSLGASVYDDKITWEATVSSVTVTIDGGAAFSASGNSQVYDFASLGTGTHSIVVTGGNYSQELVYVVNGLSRVSNFSVYGNVLVYNAVENAQYYYVSVTCGNPSHDHDMVYNGNTLTYDFSNCEMGKEGISFTVYAYAAGYVESVSETFVYSLALDGTTVKIDSATDTATWTAVQGASGYEVYIDGEYADTVTGTEYSFKYYDIDTEVTISVKPVAPGYYSEISEEASYKKSTLRTPEITGINAYTVSWSYVEGASNYIIYVNGRQFETVSNDITSYALMGDSDFTQADSYVITVRAVNAGNTNQNSQLSDEVIATDGELAELLVYEDGVVYWQYAMAAGTYYVSVNDGDETEVEGKNSFAVTFDRSGENVIKVWFTTGEGNRSLAQLSVTAYAIIFDSRAGTSVDTMYVAKGDKIYLPELTSDDYEIGMADFSGWYTLPDLSGNYDATVYGGNGTQVVSGSEFDYNGTLVLYAFWTIQQIDVSLNSGSYGVFENETDAEASIAYGSDTYTLPVPASTDAGRMFYGWYTGENGTGTRYSDENGVAITGTQYTRKEKITLYAYWIEVFKFSLTKYEGEDVLSVSKGADISKLTEITIPAEAEYEGQEYVVGVVNANAFASCPTLVTINIPDTVRFVSVNNNGYSSGAGAFASSANITAVNVVPQEGTHERFYYSEDGVLFQKSETDETVELLYYPYGKKVSSYTVPSTVSNIYEYADSSETTTLEHDVTTIGTRVFYRNPSLVSVTIPSTVTQIGIETFYNCANLETVTFGEWNGTTEVEIGARAFAACYALKSVTIPSGLADFDTSVFGSCNALENIYVSGTNGEYSSVDGLLCDAEGTTVIYCPKGRTGKVQLGIFGTTAQGVTAVGSEAFGSCIYVTEVEIGAGVTEIGDSAFSGCTGLNSVTFESGDANSVKLSIFERAFYGCTNPGFDSVELPKRLEYLGEAAFGGCTYLTYVYYDAWENATVEDLAGLQAYAFSTAANSSGDRTSYVETLELGPNVPAIDFGVIFGGASLSTIIIDSDNQSFSMTNDGALILDKAQTNVIFCGRNTKGSVTIPSTVTSIAADAFYGCKGVTEIIFNEGLKEIGDRAFYGCTSLKSVTLPASLDWLGTYDENNTLVSMDVFGGCTYLEEIIVADGNTDFISKDGVLYLANGGEASELLFCPIKVKVSEIEIPSSVTNILSNAFKDNVGVTKISFVDGKVDGELTIGDSAFQGAVNLETVELPKGLTTIGASMFAYTESIKTITIPYTVTSIGAQAFYYSTVEYVIFESADPDLGETEVPLSFANGTSASTGSEFGYTSNLVYVNIPDRTTTLSSYMFNSSAVQHVVIGAGVSTIPSYCFQNATNLQSVQFGENEDSFSQLTEIKSAAFYGADGCYDLVFPEGLTTIATGNPSSGGTSGALYQATGLRHLYFPSTLTKVPTVYGVNIETVVFSKDTVSLDFSSGSMFEGCTSLKRVEIPSCVTKLGGYTFQDCTALEEIVFLTDDDGYSALASLGAREFQNTGITSFTFPETDPERDDGGEIEINSTGELFRWCDYLTEITLSNGVQSNLDVALGQNCHLTKVNIGSCTAYSIKDGLLYGAADGTIACVVGDLGESVTIPCEITSIASYAFQYTLGLKEIYIPTSMQSIGSYAFIGCRDLETIVFYGPSEDNQFSEASSMTINSYCFRDCTALKEITLPENATAFDSGSLNGNNFQFYGCTNLEKVTLSSKTTSLGAWMFEDCTSLCVLTYTGDTGYDASKDYSSTGYMAFPSTINIICNYCFQNTGFATVYAPALSSTSNFGTYVFADCAKLTSVVFADGFSTFTTGIFSGCTALESIVIPATVTSFNANSATRTFMGCTSLTSVTFENESTFSGNTIPDYCFQYCESLVSFTLPSSITTLGTSAFDGCTLLESFEFDKISSFANYCFRNCTSLKSAHIASDVTKIGSYMFYGCTSLESVVMEQTTLTVLQNYMFNGCTSLKTVVLPDNLTYLANYTFQGCTALEEITLPTSLTALGSSNTAYSTSGSAYTFDGCTSLKKVVFNDKAAGISAYVFRNCSSLKIVTYASDPNYSSANDEYYMENGYFALPSSLTTIGNYAFQGSGLVTVTLSKFTTVGAASSGKTGNAIGIYSFADCKELVSVTFDGTSTVMGEYMFTGCSSLISVAIPATVDALGSYEFSGCSSLEDVLFMGDETEISVGAFQGCSSLLEVTIPGETRDLAEYAFDGCASLTTVYLSEGLESIGDFAFRDCVSLKEIDFPMFLEKIGDRAFAGSGLTSIYISDAVSSVGAGAFSGCTGLESITVSGMNTHYGDCDGSMLVDANGVILCVAATISGEVAISGDGIVAIGEGAFAGITGVTKITLSGVESIGDSAFEGMSDLAEVSLGDAKYVGAYAFAGTKLSSVEIPATVTEIGDHAFYGLDTLASVTFAAGSALKVIGDYAFAGTSLVTVSLGAGLESVGAYAFADIATLTSAVIDCDAELGEGLFYSDAALSSVTLGGGMSAVSDHMFDGCASLAAVTLPDGIVSVGDYAFYGTSVTAISVPGTVESIGDYAFAGLGISGVVGGAGLAKIGSRAFYGCTALTGADFSASAKLTVGSYAFAECENLAAVTFGEGTVLYIGSYAFAGDTKISSMNIYYESTMSIGEGAFDGWTETQTITIDASRFYAGRKWMSWPSENSSVESADDMWLYGCDAVVVYAQTA